MDGAEAIRKIKYGLKMETSERTPFGQLTIVRTDALKFALAALREQEERRWISVKERLPEDDPSVKKHVEGENFGFLTVLVYNGVVKQTNRFFCNAPQFGLPKTCGWEWASSNVTHWMPLPEPPKED